MASSGDWYMSGGHSGWAFAWAQQLIYTPPTVLGQQVPWKPICWHTGLLSHVSVGGPWMNGIGSAWHLHCSSRKPTVSTPWQGHQQQAIGRGSSTQAAQKQRMQRRVCSRRNSRVVADAVYRLHLGRHTTEGKLLRPDLLPVIPAGHGDADDEVLSEDYGGGLDGA